ncbi:MAG: AbrB/MazE/SpoVT family DNA-binding domain-containing protein [Alphaproteobacteria bacterium]|jgi:antitoxin MazE|nr:AbrB/MazE/SpoVT family DNA-binding domain-containing protein [Alphaproteobacteria bacterium]MDP6565421.1 AbrB/MazE/SpoVT family DNA-binding domain-containing protein [Alphaproteobacteria bacterium]MDP6816100.1 AbrB/MazE/SpoVT family DNA-binding domain-containing protein [Alphaproteobacteria bacterium]|tara:strand:- start:44 stop:283 length:240 start_codon:yes stop_codon:yes gene_type:complete
MQTSIAKWGNSLALRLPRQILADASLAEGSLVDIQVEDQRIVITPARKRYRLSDMLAKESERQRHAEVDWGEPVGNEEL